MAKKAKARQTDWFRPGDPQMARLEQKMKEREKNQNKQGERQNQQPLSSASSFPNENSLSLRERLKKLALESNFLQETQSALEEAREAEKDKDILNFFVQIVRQADELGFNYFCKDRPVKEAREEWLKLSWEGQIGLLKIWAAQGDTSAQSLVQAFAQFDSNVQLRDKFRAIVEKFERPLRGIKDYGALYHFLKEMTEQGFVVFLWNPEYVPDFAVKIPSPDNKDYSVFLPKRDMVLSSRAWFLVKEAEERARQNKEKIDELKAKATPGLTPAGISKGEEGCIFVQLSGTKAVLLRAFEENGQLVVAVVDSIGIEKDYFSSEPVLWDKKTHRPQAKGRWAWIEKGLAFQAHQERQQRQQKAEHNHRYHKLLAVITKNATLPFSFQEKGLTRLLQGEDGIVAVWHPTFEWGSAKERKFFGIALERKGKDLILQEVSSEFPFPEELKGTVLPFEVDSEAPSISLQWFDEPVEKRIFLGYKMIEKLLKGRLFMERKYEKSEGNN